MRKWVRDDDNENSIKERIRNFNYEIKSIIEKLRNKGLITTFDGMKSKKGLNIEVKAVFMERRLYK